MTDNPSNPISPNPVGTFDPAMLATLSPETKAHFADLMQGAGYDRNAVEAKLDPAAAEAPKEYAPALTPEQSTAAAVDRAFAAPDSALSYHIMLPSYMLEDNPTDTAAFLGDLKDGFFAAGVPSNLANSLAQSIFDAVEKFPDGEEARSSYLLDQTNLAKRLIDPDLKKFADIGQQALGTAGQELYQVGAFSTVNALVALSQFGRIVAQRSKR